MKSTSFCKGFSWPVFDNANYGRKYKFRYKKEAQVYLTIVTDQFGRFLLHCKLNKSFMVEARKELKHIHSTLELPGQLYGSISNKTKLQFLSKSS